MKERPFICPFIPVMEVTEGIKYEDSIASWMFPNIKKDQMDKNHDVSLFSQNFGIVDRWHETVGGAHDGHKLG